MRLSIVAAALVCALSGCQHIELRNHTARQAGSLTDLQYRQVLSNIAMFTENPQSLPYYSLAGTGVTSVTNSASAGFTPGWDKLMSGGRFIPFQFDKAGASLMASNNVGEQWSTLSILNPDELMLMRCVYQMVVGAGSCDCDCGAKIRAYFPKDSCYLQAMQPGWYCVGNPKDVPKHAAYVGRHGRRCVWVTDEGVDQLTKLTLAILDIATAVKPGDFTHLDVVADLRKKLSDRAKGLSDLIKDYPGNKGTGADHTGADKEYLALLSDYRRTVQLIEDLRTTKPAEILKKLDAPGAPPIGNDLRDLLRNAETPPSGPRDRKSFVPSGVPLNPVTIPSLSPAIP